MRIGLDFDNTIVCYDKAIALLADELFTLPEDVSRTKLGLREYLREAGRETEWTAFQGQLYGPGMRFAEPFEGAIATMQRLVAEGHELMIVSHRSKWPYAGPHYDLHEAAKSWIKSRLQEAGLFKADRQAVYFLETKKEKIDKISDLRCEVFLDDLPEILSDPQFPDFTLGLLFKPAAKDTRAADELSIDSWQRLHARINRIS